MPWHSSNILIIDDTPQILTMLRSTLDRNGYHNLSTAETLAEAKQLIDRHHYDLLIVDLQLPDGNGRDLIRQVRTIAGYKHSGILVLTVESDETQIEACFDDGADDYLVKPWQQTVLMARISNLLQRCHANQALAADESRYRSIINDQNDLICRHTPDQLLSFTNRALAELFDLEEAQLIGRPLAEMPWADRRWVDPGYWQQLNADNPTCKREQQLVDHQDRIHWIQWLDRVLLDSLDQAVEYQSVGRDITETKHAEQQLAEAQQLLNESQRIAKVGGWVYDLDKQKLTWTEQTYHIIGLPTDSEPDIAQTIARWEPDKQQAIQHLFQRACQTGEPFNEESRFYTCDGREIWVRSLGRGDLKNGKVMRVWGTFQDITEQKQVLQALAQSEHRLKLVMQATNDGMWDWHIADNRVHYSDRVAEMIGVEPADLDLTEQGAMDRVHPEDQPIIEQAVQQMCNDNQRMQIEIRVLHKDGRYRWWMTRGQIVEHDEQNQPTRVVGTYTDITERKQIEFERDRLFNLSLDMLCIVGFDGFFKQVNPAWSRTLGWTEEELLSKPLIDFVHPDDLQATIEISNSLAKNNKIIGFENRYMHADGSFRWLNWSSHPLPVEARIFAVARDVTEQKEMEDRLRYDASHDMLTGIYNRRHLIDELERQLALSRRHGQPMAFGLCDIDRFKQVNDNHGHQVGDQVLVAVTQILQDAIRTSDTLGRYGGEEFAIVFPQTDIHGAKACIERALDQLRNRVFHDNQDRAFSVTATFGIAEATQPGTTNQIIAMADRAMYRGKQQGRNRIVIAEPADTEDQLIT